MTEEKIEGELDTDTRSLDQILGINFKADGSWTASDVGNSPLYRKMNRRERRAAVHLFFQVHLHHRPRNL